MKKMSLSAEEAALETAFERDHYVPLEARQLLEIADAIAARKKDATLTIRVSSTDIRRIKQLAHTKGIPYQSYISEVIHRVAVAV